MIFLENRRLKAFSVHDHPKTLIILPAYNEEQNIARVIAQIRACVPYADVLVVNDGSSDETGPVAKAAGALVLHLPYNVGIGAGVQTGLRFAERYQYEIVVRNDGDGQHAPEDIVRLIDIIARGEVDVAIGSRFIGAGDYGTPLPRRLGIEILARLLTMITGQTITDPTSGFCALNRRAIRLFARLYPHDYPEPEAVVVLYRAGLTMREYPVTMRPREHGHSSITPVRSLYYMIKVTLAILINLLRRAPVVDAEI